MKDSVSGSARPIRVLIAADVRLYREGLAASLAGREHLSVVATTASRIDTRALVVELAVDVVVLDMATAESLELIRELRANVPELKILAFAVDEVSSEIFECAEAGAAGYVTADASVDDLAMAIERIAREELVCSPRIAAQLFVRMSQRLGQWASHADARMLTIRERQVLGLIREGYSNKEIGQKLNIAEPTVKNHVHHLLHKLDVPTRAQAAARATLRDTRRHQVPERETG
jgi:two-component system, NarL family, nitrate/nitrite response regulator NarL